MKSGVNNFLWLFFLTTACLQPDNLRDLPKAKPEKSAKVINDHESISILKAVVNHHMKQRLNNEPLVIRTLSTEEKDILPDQFKSKFENVEYEIQKDDLPFDFLYLTNERFMELISTPKNRCCDWANLREKTGVEIIGGITFSNVIFEGNRAHVYFGLTTGEGGSGYGVFCYLAKSENGWFVERAEGLFVI